MRKGEVHAAWVLEGRAIQDLFIFPRRANRSSGAPPPELAARSRHSAGRRRGRSIQVVTANILSITRSPKSEVLVDPR